jgi:hypothetical protein
MDKGIKPHSGQQRKKQEDTRRASSDPQWFRTRKNQCLSVRDRGNCVIVLLCNPSASFDSLKKGDSVDFRATFSD